MRISDWSSDVCSSDLVGEPVADDLAPAADHRRLDEAEFTKGGAAAFGDEVRNRARFAAARAFISARGGLRGFRAAFRSRFRPHLSFRLFGGRAVSRLFCNACFTAMGGGGASRLYPALMIS